MTEQRIETGGLVREGEEAFAWCREEMAMHGPLPCKVGHPDAGGRCQRTAVMEVYGLPFCEDHGAEAKAGALEEACYDAANFLERLDNPHIAPPNPVALRVLREAVRGLREAEIQAHDSPEGFEEEALKRAYPVIPGRVDGDTLDFDYEDPERGDTPVDWYYQDRMLICKLMRLVYEEGGPGYLLEVLEEDREMVSAQLAFALADLEERRPKRGANA